MARELNPRQRRFVTEYLKTGIASRAYMLAGYKASTRNALDVSACQLLRSTKVKAAIRQKRRAMLKRSDITIEKLLSDAEDARKLAMETKQVAAATGAGQFQAKLVGLLVDRRETGSPGDFAGLATPQEVIEAIRLELGEDAAKALAALVAPKAAPPPEEPGQEAIEPNAQGSGAIN
jgi:hypothetical protein